MKTLFFMLLLLGFVTLYASPKLESTSLTNGSIQGQWTLQRTQIQYVVDSHLVHEEENTLKRKNKYVFNGSTVRVEYAGGNLVQGTYRIYNEDNRKKIAIELPGTTATYNLITLTPTSMVWQQDLDNTSYQAGTAHKSAERAICTQEFSKL